MPAVIPIRRRLDADRDLGQALMGFSTAQQRARLPRGLGQGLCDRRR
jgi:hypothetical protein